MSQPLTANIQQAIGEGGYVTKWILIVAAARDDGGFSLWHASDGCAPWDVEGLLSYGGPLIAQDMDSEEE